jgi:hypothetical protein
MLRYVTKPVAQVPHNALGFFQLFARCFNCRPYIIYRYPYDRFRVGLFGVFYVFFVVAFTAGMVSPVFVSNIVKPEPFVRALNAP